MKSVIKVDFENKVIYMNRIFAKEAANAKSDEYRQLQEVRKDYPDYPVKIRTIKKQPLKESYKGLTYDFMENYMNNLIESSEGMIRDLSLAVWDFRSDQLQNSRSFFIWENTERNL